MIYGAVGGLLRCFGGTREADIRTETPSTTVDSQGFAVVVGQQTAANKAHRPDHKATLWSKNHLSVWSDGTGSSCGAPDERH